MHKSPRVSLDGNEQIDMKWNKKYLLFFVLIARITVYPHVQINITKSLRALPPTIAEAASSMSSLGSPSSTSTILSGSRLPRARTSIGSTLGSPSTSHFLFRNLYASYIRMQQTRFYIHLLFLFFYRSFRKVYAVFNWMYLFLMTDRFPRMRSRANLMHLFPVVSLHISSFEPRVSTTLCSASVVSSPPCLTISPHRLTLIYIFSYTIN